MAAQRGQCANYNRRREPQRGACYTESTRIQPPPPLPTRPRQHPPLLEDLGGPWQKVKGRAAPDTMLTLDDSGLAQGPGPGARAEEAAVLAREVAWEPLLTARLVGDRDLQYIKRYDKRDLATRRELLAEVRHPPPPAPAPAPAPGGRRSVRPRPASSLSPFPLRPQPRPPPNPSPGRRGG